MTYLKSSVKNGLETTSERFLRRFLDQTTQQLYLLPPLFSLSSGSGVPTYVRENLVALRSPFRGGQKTTYKTPWSLPPH